MIAGYILTAVMFFSLGKFTQKTVPPNVDAEKQDVKGTLEVNDTPNQPPPQSNTGLDCAGKIKVSTSGIYHLPGGAFYSRTTNPAVCFNTEAEAAAAGFRKSQR